MLIDWLSLKLPTDNLDFDLVRSWQSTQDHILKVDSDGVLVWETSSWDSVRSDSHQLAVQVTAHAIRIQGSPARVIGDGDNVFSAGAAAAMDITRCAVRMISHVCAVTGMDLPGKTFSCQIEDWSVTRVDVTGNLWLGSLPAVRQALAILRNCEGGRYRVSQQAGDTVYWSHKSRMKSGKAYAKGAELVHKAVQMSKQKKIEQTARNYSLEEVEAANGLLRLELKLGAQYWRETATKPWYEYSNSDLHAEWSMYFDRMIGGAEIMKDSDVYDRLKSVVDLTLSGKPSNSRLNAAYSLWARIKSDGWQKTRDTTSRSTWYRNLGLLKKAGLSDADISTGNVVQLRSNILHAVRVDSWAQLHQLRASA